MSDQLRVDVLLSPGELSAVSLVGKTAVVIDTLRATSTIAAALLAGALAVYPVSTIEEAEARSVLAGEDTLLAGERGGVKIAGFDLGNSPLECSSAALLGRNLVLTTSNGTPLLRACHAARRVITAALVNRRTAALFCLSRGDDVVIACAGQGGRPALEDVLTAGAVIETICEQRHEGVSLSDTALLALSAFRHSQPQLEQSLWESPAGQRLKDIGYADDIKWCAAIDAVELVPILQGEKIWAAGNIDRKGQSSPC